MLWLLLALRHRVLEHLVRQIKAAFLVDVVGLGSLGDIDVPKTQHLVSLDFNLGLAVARRDRCSIRHLVSGVAIVLQLSVVEVLGVGRWLALTHRHCGLDLTGRANFLLASGVGYRATDLNPASLGHPTVNVGRLLHGLRDAMPRHLL